MRFLSINIIQERFIQIRLKIKNIKSIHSNWPNLTGKL